MQYAFSLVYDRARYDRSLDYQSSIDPPLLPPDSAWAQELLRATSPSDIT